MDRGGETHVLRPFAHVCPWLKVASQSSQPLMLLPIQEAQACCTSAPLQPRPHLFGRATSKSPREQRCRMGRGCPITSPGVASRSLSADGQVESCSPFGVAHPKGFLLVEKKASQLHRNSVDVLVPAKTSDPLPSSGFESLQHPLTCTTSFSCKGDTWGLWLPQLLLTRVSGVRCGGTGCPMLEQSD